MYVPAHFAVSDPGQIAAFVEQAGAADLVTFDGTGLAASLLPVIWDTSGGGHGRLLGHLALANPQWSTAAPGVPALAIVHGPQAYVSPSWYPSTREHSRVVPTWNYTSVHFTGPVTFHRDADWLRDIVTRLTERHESHQDRPWRVEDAPAAYIDEQLRGIVGVEMSVARVEAKDKLSQNRSAADRAGAEAGLRGTADPGAHAIAELMRARDAAPDS
ncbi:MAG TPA: FMN-binding negative transcriptional regulator [Streptosporangiaceae bacterium]|nr:FMN-binding negative transcriptional regulator [Streptosporangiaceae bacterium]